MEKKHAFLRILPILALLLYGPASAVSVLVGGYVPGKHNLSIMPARDPIPSGAGLTEEVATIEIDNNFPDYSLVLDFTDAAGGRDLVSEVRLRTVQGILGAGLAPPDAMVLAPDAADGRFVWSPGTQQAATLNYQVRVYVTYKRPISSQPLMTVGMPSSL